MHITLLGYMGCGKTTHGKKLASRLGLPFYDLDSVVEHQYKIKVFDIFQRYGEECFRILERKSLKILLEEKERSVLSLGGGTPCFYDNMELVRKRSKSIYIQMSEKSLCDRLLVSKNKRPSIVNLNQDELLDFIKNQLYEREKYYMLADLLVKGENLVPSKLVEMVQNFR